MTSVDKNENIQSICDEKKVAFEFQQPSSRGFDSKFISIDPTKGQSVNFDIIFGSITFAKVECIVNAANSKLKHIGGIALAIAKVAGPELGETCQKYIKENGEISPGNCMVTPSGNLAVNGPIQNIIHTVGPIWSTGSKGECDILHVSVFKVLQQATQIGIKSIAIPAISCGFFRNESVSQEKVIEIIVQATLMFFKQNPDSSITYVQFIDTNKRIVQLFTSIFSKFASETTNTANCGQVKLTHKWQWRKDEVIFTGKIDSSLHEAQSLNQAKWVDFLDTGLNEIEKTFLNFKTNGGPQTINNVDLGNKFTYTIHFGEPMYQQNTDPIFSTKRRIRRVPIINDQEQKSSSTGNDFLSITQIALNEEKKDDQKLVQSPSKVNSEIKLIISGLGQNIERVYQKVQSVLENCNSSEVVYMCYDEIEFSQLYNLVSTRAEKENIKIEIINEVDCTVAVYGIKGVHLESCVLRLNVILLEEIDNLKENYLSPPPYFEEMQNQTENCKLVDVDLNSQEAQELIRESRFQKTLQNQTITRIQRVQNKPLWDRYAFLRVQIKKTRGNANEGIYWHGTRQTQPALIYENGFDFRLSREGLFGRGAYFAHNASYSNSYAYNSGFNRSLTKQFFAAFVTLGSCFKSPQNRQIVRPPDGHDSVTGFTNGSDVYIIYDLGQAYPAYLISFQ